MKNVAYMLVAALGLAMVLPASRAVAQDDDQKKEVVWAMNYSGGGA